MAITDLLQQYTAMDTQTLVITASSIALGLLAAYLYICSTVTLSAKSPPLVKGEEWPIIGSFRFFTSRLDFCRDAAAHSSTGQFSFTVGRNHVVGLTGDESRRIFLESKELDLDQGYATLFAGGAPPPPSVAVGGDGGGSDPNEKSRFSKRLLQMLKRENFVKGLPYLMSDTRTRLDMLAKDPKGITDPFESIYTIVYQLTMRTVACLEIAEDPKLLARTLKLFEDLDAAISPEIILFPWFPSPAKLKRYWYGGQLYMIFKKIVDDRKKAGRREDDPLQFLIDKGDSISDIIAFVLGALFAGQINSGINAAWVVVYLANNPHWAGRVKEEVIGVAENYDTDSSKPLADRLANVPLEAWESEFPNIDLCLRDSIRIQALGAMLRQNTSDRPVKIGNEEIPPGAFAAYSVGDIHLDPEVYRDPHEWDPSRYLPDRAEDQKKKYSFLGWGAARHPCLGQRFAKLEQNVILAFFVAYFDFGLCDEEGKPRLSLPKVNANGTSAQKPKEKVYIKYNLRA